MTTFSDPNPTDKSAALRTLIDTQNIRAMFQPIVCHESGEIIGFECFTRPGEGSGIANATELFDLAERHGLTWELEDLSRCLLLNAGGDLPEGQRLFFNVSPTVAADPRFADRLDEQVSAVPGLSPSRLVIEITERAEHGSVECLAVRVAELKSLGFQIAVDDVGAGVSGLNRLMLLRPHWLKLDIALVERINEDRFKQNLIHFFVHFANLSGVKLIAEGVERREELATLIDSGVLHSQGYHLARPATGYQLLPQELASWTRQRWSRAQLQRAGDPRRAELGTLCQPATCVQASTSVSELASELLRDASVQGVVVLDGRRFVGWCPRRMILDAASGPRSGMPVGFVTPGGVTTLSPGASLGEALSLVSVRNDDELASPLVIAHQEAIVGIVPLRSLVSAASQGTRPSPHGGMPLTGLPTRVTADRHLAELVQHAVSQGGIKTPLDAVFIDVRSFADCNGVFGYETGDRLLRELGELIRSVMIEPSLRQGEDGFLSHLGDDRFLAIVPQSYVTPGLQQLVTDFEGMIRRAGLIPTPESPVLKSPEGLEVPTALPIGLRVLRVPDLLARIAEPRDLFRLEAQLRQRARTLERSALPGESIVVVDHRINDQHADRKSA